MPDALRAGRRTLEELEAVTIVRDWEPDGPRRWRMEIEITPGSLGSVWEVPATTRWFVRAVDEYPGGLIDILPSLDGGLAGIFPHQLHGAVSAGAPYRGDKICVATDTEGNLRTLDQAEPRTAVDRLAWHVNRAAGWLRDASEGKLLAPGAHFELPFYPGTPSMAIAFREGPDDLAAWDSVEAQAGTADLARLTTSGVSWRAATVFRSLEGTVVARPSWGDAILGARAERSSALWVRCPAFPVLPPYAGPRTWGALRNALAEQGCDLDLLLRELVARRRDARRRPLLLGFPVPAVVGGPAQQLHWLAIDLPPIPAGGGSKKAHEREAASWVAAARTIFAPGAPVPWVVSENWHPDELATRGRLAADLTRARVLLIGAGAVGSALAELLVRAGALDLTVLDHEALVAQNLVRHTLTMTAIGASKALALAARLRTVTPNARVKGMADWSGNLTGEFLAGFDLVVETTGDHQVLEGLEQLATPTPVAWASISISAHARRLFAFIARGTTIPVAAFDEAYGPFAIAERERGEELPMAGVGCWHPVFPARADEVWIFAAAGVGLLNDAWPVADGDVRLHVFERITGGDGSFAGIRKVAP